VLASVPATPNAKPVRGVTKGITRARTAMTSALMLTATLSVTTARTPLIADSISVMRPSVSTRIEMRASISTLVGVAMVPTTTGLRMRTVDLTSVAMLVREAMIFGATKAVTFEALTEVRTWRSDSMVALSEVIDEVIVITGEPTG